MNANYVESLNEQIEFLKTIILNRIGQKLLEKTYSTNRIETRIPHFPDFVRVQAYSQLMETYPFSIQEWHDSIDKSLDIEGNLEPLRMQYLIATTQLEQVTHMLRLCLLDSFVENSRYDKQLRFYYGGDSSTSVFKEAVEKIAQENGIAIEVWEDRDGRSFWATGNIPSLLGLR